MRISLVGVPGCGKTTVLRELSVRYDCDVVYEPVDAWAPWLDAYYTDPHRYAFGMQVRVLRHFESHRETTRGDRTVWFERSPVDSKDVFGNICREYMSSFEWELYEDVYEQTHWKPDLVVYLHVDPDVAWERVVERRRESERAFDRRMWDRIFQTYRRVYDYRIHAMPLCIEGSKHVCVDANGPIEDVVRSVYERVKKHVAL